GLQSTAIDSHIPIGHLRLASKTDDLAREDLFLSLLILLLDLFAEGLGYALHGFGFNLQAGKHFQIFPPIIKSLFSSHLTHHTTYPRRSEERRVGKEYT